MNCPHCHRLVEGSTHPSTRELRSGGEHQVRFCIARSRHFVVGAPLLQRLSRQLARFAHLGSWSWK